MRACCKVFYILYAICIKMPETEKEKILTESGMSKNEAKVYLALLDLGQATAGKIAEKSAIHRTNVYDALERLIEKGVITYIIKKDIKHYHATNPENLLNVIKEKEIHLMQILPELKLAQKLSKAKPKAEILEGSSGLKIAFYDLLKYKKTIYIVGIPKEAHLKIKYWIERFHKEHAKQKIWMVHIYNPGAKERIKYLKTLPYIKVRCLPEKYDSPVSLMSCGEEVLIIMWDLTPIITIRVKNAVFSTSVEKWFNLMWDIAKDV